MLWLHKYYLRNIFKVPMQSVMLWVRISIRVRCTTICDKVCQWLATGRWCSLGPPVSSAKKTYRQNTREVLLKVAVIMTSPWQILNKRTIVDMFCSKWTLHHLHLCFEKSILPNNLVIVYIYRHVTLNKLCLSMQSVTALGQWFSLGTPRFPPPIKLTTTI
jgi:hypothetical protein